MLDLAFLPHRRRYQQRTNPATGQVVSLVEMPTSVGDTGRSGADTQLAMRFGGVTIDVKAIVSDGRTVIVEQIDTFEIASKPVRMDVVGVFEIEDDESIKRWRGRTQRTRRTKTSPKSARGTVASETVCAWPDLASKGKEIRKPSRFGSLPYGPR